MAEGAGGEAEGEEASGEGAVEKEDVIGVPHLVIDVSDRSATSTQKVLDSGKLPTVEEVWHFTVSMVMIEFFVIENLTLNFCIIGKAESD